MGKDSSIHHNPQDIPAIICPVASNPYLKVATYTGNHPDASTDARIYLDLYGEGGHVRDLYLEDQGDNFQVGTEDVFFFPNPQLGPLTSARLTHDDSGDSPNWYLNRIEVTDVTLRRTFTFTCNGWLGRDEGQGARLEVSLTPSHLLRLEGIDPNGNKPSIVQSDGSKTMRYHMVVTSKDRSRPSSLARVVEAVQLSGFDQQGRPVSSSIVVLESSDRSKVDLLSDKHYVKAVQDRARRLPPPPSPSPSLPPSSSSYQVSIYSSGSFAPGGGVWVDRELSIVLHGTFKSSPLLPLSSLTFNGGSLGGRPFTPTSPSPSPSIDSFTLHLPYEDPNGSRSNSNLGEIIRVDLSANSRDWGLCIDRLTLKDLSVSVGAQGGAVPNLPNLPLDFFPPPLQPLATGSGSGLATGLGSGYWMGACPGDQGTTQDSSRMGHQNLTLLPGGVCIVTFNAEVRESPGASFK